MITKGKKTDLDNRSTTENMEVTRKVRKSYLKELRKRNINLPSTLLVFYAIPITMSVSIGQGIIMQLFNPCSDETNSSERLDPVEQWLKEFLIFGLHPLMGWLADTKLGRDKAISLSLWFCWIGAAIQTVSRCIQYENCTNDWINKTATYGLSLVALLLLITGIACYQSIILAYGLDQLPDASTAQIKRFINWLTWGFFVGFFINYLNVVKTVGKLSNDLVLGTTLATFGILSLALILHMHLKHKFYPSGKVSRNPYSTVINVLKYARKHKKPENRSAFTYWEDTVPSRIDYAKTKYGGPFPESDVEDTKLFWKIVIVFVSLGGFFISYSTVVSQGAYYGFQFHGASEHVHGYGAYVLWQTFYQIGIIAIPLIDLIVLPLFPKIEYFFTNSFKGFIVAIVLQGLGLISMIIIEGIAVHKTPGNITCPLSFSKFPNTDLRLSYFYFMIPWLFIGLSAFLILLKSFEFICSQAPHEMSGMLTGVFWLIRAIFISIGTPLTLLHISNSLPCTFWVIVVQLCACIPFWIIFVLISIWYQKRIRELEFPIRNITERHYSRFIHTSYASGNTQEVFNKYDLPVNGWSDNSVPIYSLN